MAKEKIKACPCGSGLAYSDCCGQFIQSDKAPGSAELLMRSRYTAYALGNEPYLLATWHVSSRPDSLGLDNTIAPKWVGLTILRHEQTDSTHAVVEFVARYKINGRAFKLQEASRFVKEEDRWFYVDGDIKPETA